MPSSSPRLKPRSQAAPVFALDAQFSPSEAGGTETHVPLQLDALARFASERFLVLGAPDSDEELRPLLGENMELVPYPVRYAWFKGRDFPISAAANDALLRAHGASAVHFPYPQHFATSLPFVYEPWGLPHRHFPEFFQAGEPEWMDGLFRSGCENAAIIVTGTRWARDDIARTYGVPLSKFAVLPRNPIFRPPAPRDGKPRYRGVPERFALYPSAAWPHKNHVGLLKALAILRDEHGVRLDLVCTGKFDTTAADAIRAALAELGLQDQVQFLGPIPREDLERLFHDAMFLVHASRFEGLGLPLIEAMSYGLPILASTATCIPEVVGDAALLFDPEDPAAMAAAMLQAVQSEALRDDLGRRATQRLAAFFPSHRQLAESFVALYKAAAGLELSAREQALMEAMTA